MAIQNSKYSFVDFQSRLETVVLPAIDSMAVQFQFYLPAEDNAPITREYELGVCDITGTTILHNFGQVTKTCLWGVITGVDLEEEFPITIGAGEIIPEGTYETKDEFFDALQSVGVQATDQTFLHCCDLENVHDLSINYSGGTIAINFYAGFYFASLGVGTETTWNTNPLVNPGECFRYCLLLDGEIVATSNQFQRRSSTEKISEQHTWVTYSCNEDAYNFYYPNSDIENSCWLPLYCRNPKYPETRKVYLKSNKQYKVLSAILEKTREVITDNLPEKMHDRIAVMMAHDNIHFKNIMTDADVYKKDDYDIGELDIIASPPVAQAKFTITETFEGRNSNCDKPKVCAPFPSADEGGGDCVGVTIPSFALPPAMVGEAYFYSITLSGDQPFGAVVTDEAPDWMTIALSGTDTVTFTGTPTSADVGITIPVAFHVTNCDGEQSDSFSGTLVVNEEEIPEVTITDHNTCTPGLRDSSFNINGAEGTIIGVSMTMSGLIDYDVASSHSTVTAVCSIGLPTNDGSANIGNIWNVADLSADTGFTLNSPSVLFLTIPAGGVLNVTIDCNLENGGTLVSATFKIVSVNGNPASITTPICAGYSTSGG